MEVTPLAGVWVEIFIRYRDYNINIVTPLAGVWVEILTAALSRVF